MAQVFISYQKRDRALVERVRDGLIAAGLTVWWDDDVTPRENWDRILEREIQDADYVLVLWTENSIDSNWVRTEVAWTLEHKPGKLVQARFRDARIPMLAYLTQYVDLAWDAPERSGGWSKLLEWLGKPQPVAPRAPPPPTTPVPARPAHPVRSSADNDRESAGAEAERSIPWTGVQDALVILFYACGALITAWGLLMLFFLNVGPILGGSFTATERFNIISTMVLSLAAGILFLARVKLSSKLIYAWAILHVVITFRGPPAVTLSGSLIFGFSLLAAAAALAFMAARSGWLKR